MPESSENNRKISNLESELYLLIAKFLRTGPCKRTAEVLKEELEEHKLMPKRIDWLGNEHNRSFNELDSLLSQISDDHLLKICSRIGPILDKELPPTVPGLKSLLGVGHQSLLRTKEDLEKPKYQINNLAARKHGTPLYPSPNALSTYPPNIAQVLTARELSGSISSRHAFSPKIYARQQPYRRLLGHLSSVYCVLFDRTGKYIFTGADDNLVKIWSAVDGRLLATLRGHSAEITDMAVNYENTLLAAGSCDKTIRVWCLHSTAPIAVLNGHTGMVTSLQFCPYPKNKDQLLISTGNDGCICFWQWNPQTNVFNPKPVRFTERNKAGAQMICSSFSTGGLFLATGSTDHCVRVYNIAGFNGPSKILEREIHTDRVDSLQFSNRDCRFVSGSKDGTALIWKYERQNWSSIQLKMTAKLPSDVSNEAEDSKVKLRVTMVGWTLDDTKVVTAVSDYSIKVWNSFNGTLCHILKGHEDEVFVLEAHPTDSRIFLSSGHDGRIILWDLVSGSSIKNHFNLIEGQGHGAVFDCKFSPDGLMFASTDSHGHLCIFGYGSNERYKKVPEEQFFHTDYRPLIRDINHHVLDEQTQTPPHLLPPPFLVDIDGNPYPPNLQRLVPGREHCNDSQLVPYVAVFAEGESEILQPVRPANDGPSDRPTIDDMIERLQQEQQNQNQDNQDSSDSGNRPGSSDSFRSPRSNRRRSVANEERNEEPFSPRTPRSQAGHSRVGLRRTGESEGVQSVGNWQSRVNQGELPAWVKRVVVKPISASLSKSYYERRQCLADYELTFFNKELKKRVPDPNIEYDTRKKDERQTRRGIRTSARIRNQDENSNNVYGEDFENPERVNMNTSTDSETEQEEEEEEEEESANETSEDSGSEYSDWAQPVRSSRRENSASSSKPSTSGRTGPSREARLKKRLCCDHSDNDETEAENDAKEEDDVEDDESTDESESAKKTKKKTPGKKKMAVNGKKFDRYRPPEWLTDVMPHKAPYVPQIGDVIVYFRQGHELYVQAVKRNKIYEISMRSQPWRKINLRDTEVAQIEDITFENRPPRLCCLKLNLLNPASKQAETFTVKYHDMPDVIEFIVLKQYYDQAMQLDWKPGDRFRSAIDKAWWLGTIKSQKPLNPDFPDSMFQCFLVKWDNGEKEHMSPWDFEPIDNERLPEEEGGSVEILPDERQAMMYFPDDHEWSNFGRDYDCDRIERGILRIMELSIAESFVTPVDLTLYPSYAMVVEYPMDLGTIKARVHNRFYRRLDSLKFDVRFIYLNAKKFNRPDSKIVKQAKCVVDLCLRFIESPCCVDPMAIYHEMMEAKQSRSQDSQSELDVLCSESDCDGDRISSKRLKRKKNAMQQSSKRVRIGSQKYTSASWKHQCSKFLEEIFKMDDSTPFQYPVSLVEYPDYRNIIDCPMDLTTVREKLDNNHYYSPTDFCKDMRLIFQNSRNYNTNKRSRIYSMTIRLSAMFEEEIRKIIGDWRSAVKYEEKIRNNQYVSNRRKPVPASVQDSLVNVGASTSRGSSSFLPSTSRGESSKQSTSKITNSYESSKNSHSNKIANGTGPKKIIKSDRLAVIKSALRVKRKHIKNAIGSPLTNGVSKKQNHRVLKRKLPEKTSQKRTQNLRKREPSNTEGSHSDSNPGNQSSSPENSENNDTDWSTRKVKRLRRDKSKFHKNLRHSPRKLHLRPRKLLKHKSYSRRLRVRSHSSSPDNHVVNGKKSSPSLLRSSKKHLRSSSPDNHVVNNRKASNLSPRATRRLRFRSRSSSPDNPVATVKKPPEKPMLSPLHTRSRIRREHGPIIHSLRNATVKPKSYRSSGDSSESDESVNNRKSTRLTNGVSTSNIPVTRNQKNQINYKYQESSNESDEGRSRRSRVNYKYQESVSNESEESSEHQEEKVQLSTRAASRYKPKATSSALTTAPPRKSPKKLGTIQTRNRGQRTVRYDEDSDSENAERIISFSSRGRLQNLPNDTERNDCDSIEENFYNGDTSLSETEVNYSNLSTTENESETECENIETYSSLLFRPRLRPRKRTKNYITNAIQSLSCTDTSSFSGFKGRSRCGKYKNKCLNSNRIYTNYRKAMLGKVVLPIFSREIKDSEPAENIISGRKRSRKSKVRRHYNLRTGRFMTDTSEPNVSYQNSISLSSPGQSRAAFPRYVSNSALSKRKYQRMGLKKLGLKYRRKAMLCKIVLPILTVTNKVSFHSSKRGRWRRNRNGQNKSNSPRNEFSSSSSSSSYPKKFNIDDYTNSSLSSAAQTRYNLKERKSTKYRDKLARSRTLRNEISKIIPSTSNVSSRELDKVDINSSSRLKYDSEESKVPKFKKRIIKSSILRNELFKNNSNSTNSFATKPGIDEFTNSSGNFAAQLKYSPVDQESSSACEVNFRNKAKWNLDPLKDQNQTEIQGHSASVPTEISIDSDRTENFNENNISDTHSMGSISSAETSLLYFSDATEVSSDTQSTQGFKDISENNSHLQDNEPNQESAQTRNSRQLNSVYENVDVFCNNAVMFDGNSVQ